MTPEEDDISKRQLWERIESGRAATESHAQELHTRIKDLVDTVNNSVQVLVQENLKMAEQSKKVFSNNVSDSKKEFEKIINNALTTFIHNAREHAIQLDKRLTGVKKELVSQCVKEIDNRMDFLTVTAKTILDTAEKEREFHTVQMNKFQTETRNKMAAIEKKLDDTILKFKVISDSLSRY